MKKNIYCVSFLLLFYTLKAQIGINTPNPQAILHVDGAKDNTATGVPTIAQQANDFVVTATGRIGIGTTTPSQKLEIQTGGTPASPVSGFKLADGNQNSKYVLTTDDQGSATWKAVGMTAYYGTIGAYNTSQNFTVSSPNYWTGSSITLPPGQWVVNIFMIINFDNFPFQVSTPPNNGAWIRSTFCDSSTVFAKTNDFVAGRTLVSGSITGPANYNTMSGSVIINNKSGNKKTYYYWRDISEIYDYSGSPSIYNDSSQSNISPNPYHNTNFKNSKFSDAKLIGFGQSKWGENIIYAYPVISGS
ncbi:hypothetical protein [Chryseobacterium sp. MEBOG07]|uniref:hypothetical protein n=1 Tax=Chryseobacterium sp. MEBOG07 TaxID=2879939 RepID=UPI001F47B9D8|nr:hypothetical protein [Chryseobacterium sp. MEBOG07]UKB78335.1 hypothetical protein LF886_17890 [Chryseobacterium sp. MEBOG07]